MSDIKESIRVEVVEAYNEYNDYMQLISKENKDKNSRAEDIKKDIESGENEDAVEEFALQVHIIDDFHRRDLQILGTKFVNIYRLYMNLPDMEDLPSEVKTLFTKLDDRKEQQVFVVEKGKFEEINKGFVEDRIKVIKEKNLMPKILENLKSILNK